MKHFLHKKILLTPRPGASINNCINEATMFALQEGCEVKFKFNQLVYKINPEELADYIYNRSVTTEPSETSEI